LWEDTNYKVGMASNGITFTSDSMIITQLVQNLDQEIHIDKQRYGDVMSILFCPEEQKVD
jgi:hypothetical protein